MRRWLYCALTSRYYFNVISRYRVCWVKNLSNFQLCLPLKWCKTSNMSSLALTLFLMMALVSSGSAVSITHPYEHGHSQRVTAAQPASFHAFHAVEESNGEGNTNTNNAVSKTPVVKKTSASHEFTKNHCQHQEMSMKHAEISASLSADSNTMEMTQISDANAHRASKAQMADMPCCEDECNCPADHCFNLSASALLQPSAETEVSVARMAAPAPVLGQCITLHFGQFRPPKSLLTA